jgi:GWxTD domain-containing protein
MKRPVAALIVAVLGGALPARGQAPADRAALQALRDSLGLVRDTAALRRVEAATIARARVHRDDALLHLRLGFIAYRLGELGAGKPSYDDAAGEFEWASELRPDWPYAWYGLGLAELALGEHSVIAIENLRQMLGRDYLSRAARAFARAAQADPGFAEAVVDLANTALSQRVQARIAVALEAVRLAAASAAGRDAALQLARGRVEREAGEVDSALAGFRGALAAGADSGVALLELARTLFYARQPAEGRRQYYAGVRAAASAAARALLREDLQWAASPAELAAFDALPDSTRAGWLRAFWQRRDAAEVRDEGERLAEHYRRWFYVRQHFRLVSRHRHYDITEVYRNRDAEFDDRGVIYLRHGEPDRRASYVCLPTDAPGCAPNESWLYRRPGAQDLIVHFAARDDVQDFKLIESLIDVFGFRAGVGAAAGSLPTPTALYESREAFGVVYQRGGRSLDLVGERRDGRRNIAIGTTTDSYAQRFDLPLQAIVQSFVVGSGAAAGSDAALHVVFAIPAERLTPQPAADGVVYPLRFRVVVVDTAGATVARLDTTRIFGAPQPLRRPAYLTGRMALPVPPGAWRYRVLMAQTDGAAGEVVDGDSLVVDTLDGRRFAASDVVLGVAGSGLTWVLEGDTLALNPLGSVTQDRTLEVYYQVYGLASGAAYRTEIEVAREGGGSLWSAIGGLFGGKRAPVRLAFDAEAQAPRAAVHRSIALKGVSRGKYVLTVRLTDASGRTLVRTRRFTVVAP